MQDGLYEILEATKLEVQAIHQLVNSAYRGESSKKGWTTEANLLDGIRIDEAGILDLIERDDSVLFIYLEEDQLLACVNLEKRNKALYLGMLTVSPELQGKGIGKKLLSYCEEFGMKQACNSIEMTVISQRTELIDWYVRHGYVITGEKRPFPVDAAKFGEPKIPLEFIVLRKKLTA